MKHYVKNIYDFAQQTADYKDTKIPSFICQREKFRCPHCDQTVLIAVPPTSIDWEAVARDYRRYAEEMWRDCNLLLAEAGLDTLLERKMRRILEKCRANLERPQG